jgi:O-antigen/teichoic acid export membrane protein
MENVMLANISQDPADRQASAKVFRNSFKLLSLIAFPIFCFFLFAHREFYAVIFEHRYDASIPVFITSLLMIPLRITHYGVILQAYGKANQLLFGSVIDIMLSLLLMLVLYPILGTIGIMLALVISTYLQVIYYLFVSARILQVTLVQLIPFKYLAILLLVLLAFFYGLSFVKPLLTDLAYLVLLFSIASAIVLVALYRYFSNRKTEST